MNLPEASSQRPRTTPPLPALATADSSGQSPWSPWTSEGQSLPSAPERSGAFGALPQEHNDESARRVVTGGPRAVTQRDASSSRAGPMTSGR